MKMGGSNKFYMTVKAELQQVIEIDPKRLVGLSESQIWGLVDQKMRAEARFQVAMPEQDQWRLLEMIEELEKDAPECAVCGEIFSLDADVVVGDGGGKAHRVCHLAKKLETRLAKLEAEGKGK